MEKREFRIFLELKLKEDDCPLLFLKNNRI